MQYILAFLILLITHPAISQSVIPFFLEGTWKMVHKENYEHWNKINDQALKGFSYKLQDGKMVISEYLDIVANGNKVTYTARVINQNQGKAIDFKLIRADSIFVFSNPQHDFPKEIIYQKLSDNELLVRVSDGDQKGFSYKMVRQNATEAEKDSTISNPDYDRALAEKLGADDYGMKSYILVMLKTGNHQITDKSLINQHFRGHMDNINRLVEEGKLIVAGPLGKNDQSYRGIFILDAPSFEEAEQLLVTDPAIKEGLLDYELYNWYGSAALPEYLEVSDKIWKVSP